MIEWEDVASAYHTSMIEWEDVARAYHTLVC